MFIGVRDRGFRTGWTSAYAAGRPFAGLESVCGLTPTVGSNTTATAILTRAGHLATRLTAWWANEVPALARAGLV